MKSKKKKYNITITKGEAISILNNGIDSFKKEFDTMGYLNQFKRDHYHLADFVTNIFPGSNYNGEINDDIVMIQNYCKNMCNNNYEEEKILRDNKNLDKKEFISTLEFVISMAINNLYQEMELDE